MTQAVNDRKSLGSEYPPPKFISDRWITGITMAFLLAFLIFFMLYPVYDICRLSFFKGRRNGTLVRSGQWQFRISQEGTLADEEVFLAIRPEKIEVFKPGDVPASVVASNCIPARIDVVTFLGAAVRLVVGVGDEEVISDVIEKEFEQKQLRQGDEVLLYFPPESFLVYPVGENSQ